MRSALRWASGSAVVCAPASGLPTAKVATDIKNLVRACSIVKPPSSAEARAWYSTTVITQPRPVSPPRFETIEAVALPDKEKAALARLAAPGRPSLQRLV